MRTFSKEKIVQAQNDQVSLLHQYKSQMKKAVNRYSNHNVNQVASNNSNGQAKIDAN